MTRIERFGWRGAVEPGIGRVVSAHGDYYHLVCNEAEGEILARKKKSSFGRMKTVAPDDMKGAKKSELQASEPLKPITGDFVRFRHNAQGDSMILEVLPRFSHFERRDPAARRTSQTLAVNFDTLFIMMSLNEDFSTARIDRYLALAEDIGGGEAVVVLTKADLWRDGDEEFEGFRPSIPSVYDFERKWRFVLWSLERQERRMSILRRIFMEKVALVDGATLAADDDAATTT